MMNNKIINNFLIVILACLTSINVMALNPNHTFNYQGQLLDNDIPANGSFDITVSAYISSIDNTIYGKVSEHLAVDVNNGLFNLTNVDIVDSIANNPFDGFELHLQIAVRPAGTATYETLGPRQMLHAVPYANNLTVKGANDGQILIFNGALNGSGTWEPQELIPSPWVFSGSGITYPGLAIMTRVNDASFSPSTGVLVIGNENDLNLVMDSNELMARDNGTSSPLLLQHDGGVVRINQNAIVADASLADGGALILGSSNQLNLVFDNNEILARNNGAASTLFVGADAGVITDGTGENKGLLSIGAPVSQMTIDGDDIQRISNGAPAHMFLNFYGGNVTIGSSGATTNIRGTFTNTSDKRFKKDIEDLSYGLAEILVLNPKEYNWINSDNEHKSFGLIAQEVQEVMKELVHSSDDKMESLSLSYIELVPVMIKAIQEQQSIIEQMEKNNKIQNKKIEKLILLMESNR